LGSLGIRISPFKPLLLKCTCMKRVNYLGKRFERLVVTKRADDYIAPGGTKHTMWHCRCDCGKEVVRRGAHIGASKTRSCGCLYAEVIKRGARLSHGLTHSNEYRIWAGIKSRCFDKNCSAYKWYGARGITMCREWAEDFEQFLKDMGPRPPGLSIDRINNDGNYEPGNCRWATKSEQAKNSRHPGSPRRSLRSTQL
jgi:hypothetical protein